MKLKPKQLSLFWRSWSAIIKANAWPKTESETHRHALLARAGFGSLTKVDPLTGFDRVLAELAALSNPTDLAPQLRAQAMPRIRALHAIHALDKPFLAAQKDPAAGPDDHYHAPALSHYTSAILKAQHGHDDLDRLSLPQLTHIKYTLTRASGRRKKRERAANEPF